MLFVYKWNEKGFKDVFIKPVALPQRTSWLYSESKQTQTRRINGNMEIVRMDGFSIIMLFHAIKWYCREFLLFLTNNRCIYGCTDIPKV